MSSRPHVDAAEADRSAQPCPVCRARRSVRLFEARDPHYGISGRWWVRDCRACSSWFLEAPPAPDELLALYPEESYYSFRIQRVPRWRRRLRRLVGLSEITRDPSFPAPGHVLDFGSGAGEFLIRMRRRGWECAGVESSAAARAAAAAEGVDVRPAILGEEGFEPGSFDYVRANHSLEHVTDPGSVLRDLYTACKPGGAIFVGVPTTSGMNARLFGPDWWYLTPPLHPVVFSTPALLSLVRDAGFEDARAWTRGDYASTMGSLQIRMNRGTSRRSAEGVLFRLKPLLVVGHWTAQLQGALGAGDRLEVIARKPRAPR